ncbi:MAG: PilT/PilU family type 4a pilus ATPase [Lentisphaeria bacterium]|nr:PilT/PilU family type 4a pilus ATPase [Lentisphaeria bacterium]
MDITAIFSDAAAQEANDLFITCGKTPSIRKNGTVIKLENTAVPSKAEIDDFRNGLLDEHRRRNYLENNGADSSFECSGNRFRINFYETFYGPALVARPIKQGKDCTFERYNIPDKVFVKLAQLQRGLVIFSGSTGCGKSTTMSCLINHINSTRNCHILMLEDPVEFIHEDRMSLISQREISSISGGTQAALRDAMRENPDIIVVGEMRDTDTIISAITAALTGHLVIATMHTQDTATTVERIITMFPEQRRDQIASSISLALEAVICQRLLPSGNEVRPAFEVLLGTDIVRKYISYQDFSELERCLRAYAHLGMCSFNDSMYDLYRRGLITFECAEEFSDNKDELRLMRSGIKSGTNGYIATVYSTSAIHSGEIDMSDLFKATVRAEASDLLLTAGVPPQVRIAGSFVPLELPDLDGNDTQHLIHSLLSRRQRVRLEEEKSLDFAMSVKIPDANGRNGNRRFRINAFYQKGQMALVARLLAENIPTPQELGLPPVLRQLMLKKQGFMLITGPTGSGKSTTLASLIDYVNDFSHRHIITIEDPIEYVHVNKKCIIEQREIGNDTLDFSGGLRAAMRQAPDIIMVGEMRDKETIAAALTAAETGHLVLGTLHSNNAMQTIERIIDSFPEGQQNQVRQQFAATVLAVVSQRLIPRLDIPDARIAAFEVMTGTYAVRALIRDKKTHQLISTMESSQRDGMMTMQRSLENLVDQGIIDERDAEIFDSGT